MPILDATEYKTRRGITGTDYDTILAIYVEQATEEIESLCGRTSGGFEGDTFTEKFDGDGTPVLKVSNGPISSISSIKFGNSTQTTVDSGSYVFKDRTIMFVRGGYQTWDGSGVVTPCGYQNVEVVYTTASAVNDHLQQVAAQLIDHYLDSRGRDFGKLTEVKGNTTITVRSAADFREKLLDMLRPWRDPV